MNRFAALLATNHPILADGAMGTQLHASGVDFGACFDALNTAAPASVAGVHRGYLDAGADVIETNTFGANRYKLAAHGLEARVAEINTAGVAVARRAIEASFRDVGLLGAVGPLGVRLAPYGRVRAQQAQAAFEEQLAALAAAGVDGLIFETFSDLNEIAVAIEAARTVAPDLLVIASLTFTRDDRTLLGDTPEQAARALHDLNADVIGVNCASGPAQLLRLLQQMHAVTPQAVLAVMPNAGWPERVGDRIMYRATPEYFAKHARAFIAAGARIIGGCCGTTPAHIRAMRAALDAPTAVSEAILHPAGATVEINGHVAAAQPTQLAEKLANEDFVVSVEVDPPKGHSPHRLLAGVDLLASAGADVINVADAPLARMRMSAWAVCHLIQQQIGIETVLHFPTRGRNLLRLQGDLLAAHALEVRNLFVVLGDPTAIGDYPEALDEYDLAPSGLVKLITQRFNRGLDHSGGSIGQPTSFLVGCALNPQAADREREARVLRRKIANGADFAITQPTFDIDVLRRFVAFYEAEYERLRLPLLVGVLPLYGTRHAEFLNNEVPGIVIPPAIRERIAAAPDGPACGTIVAVEMIGALRALPFVRGVYLMPPFGRFDMAAEIIEQVKSKVGVGS